MADGEARNRLTVSSSKLVTKARIHPPATPGAISGRVTRRLVRFTREVQPVKIALTVTNSREIHDLVQAGDGDLGFALTVGRSMLVAAPPIELPGLVVLLPGHHLAQRDVVELSDLEDEPYISPGRQYRLRDQVDELFTLNGVTPKLVAETQNAPAACVMVAAGLGFTISDAVTINGIKGYVVARTLRPTVMFSVNVLANPGRPLSSVLEKFVNFVRFNLNI